MDQPGLPARSDRRVAFTYNDHVVEFDDRRLVDVTQMWRAAGSPPNKEFKDWRRYVGASFVQDLANSLRVGKSHLIRSVSKRGDKGGGTWAHWQIALAYAKYLSNDFHRFVNEAFREWVEERADPGLKARRAVEGYERQGRDRVWIKERLDGIVERNDLTDTHLSDSSAFIGNLWRVFEAKDQMEARMARGPVLEQIEGVDTTFRVVSYSGKNRYVHAEICLHYEAIGIARQIWATEQPIDRVCVVDERTGFTKDEIYREG